LTRARESGDNAGMTAATDVPRHFTVEQANRMLPLVGRIAADIVRDYRRWQDAVAAFEVATSASRADAPDPHALRLQREAQSMAAEIEGYVRELAALGVECKSFDLGLVDFPGEVDGAPAYLCWRLGEPSVQWWHRRDAGFAGRRPLTAAPAAPAVAEAAP
jgi:hypothetical protein